MLGKAGDSITRTTICWIPEGKRKRGHPKTKWCRTVEAEMKDLGHSWSTIKRLAEDRTMWRSFVAALNAYRHKGRK